MLLLNSWRRFDSCEIVILQVILFRRSYYSHSTVLFFGFFCSFVVSQLFFRGFAVVLFCFVLFMLSLSNRSSFVDSFIELTLQTFADNNWPNSKLFDYYLVVAVSVVIIVIYKIGLLVSYQLVPRTRHYQDQLLSATVVYSKVVIVIVVNIIIYYYCC